MRSFRSNVREIPAWLGLVVVIGLIGCQGKARPEPFVFGHLAPRTGSEEAIGREAWQAVELLVEPHNAALGEKDRRLLVVHGDTASAETGVGDVLIRMVTLDRTHASIGGFTAREAEQLAGAAPPPPLLQITRAGLVPGSRDPMLFAIGLAPGAIGSTLARQVIESDKAKTIVLLVRESAAPARLAADAFEQQARSLKTPPTRLPLATPPAREDVIAVQERKADAIVIAGTIDDALAWNAALRQAGVTAPVTWIGEEDLAGVLSREGQRAADLRHVSAFWHEDSTERCQAFVKAYREKYQRTPGPAAALSHDALNVLHQVFKKADTGKPLKLRETILAGDAAWDVLTGSLTFGADQQARRPLFLLQTDRQGQTRLIRRLDPPPPPTETPAENVKSS
jgi:branched-chain amino acid transport system substrate-binding protein